MKKYAVKSLSGIGVKDQYLIVERKTNYVIAVRSTQQAARKVVDHMNSGGAFDGETPTFFVDKDVQQLLETA
jgi:hypothetical protein